MDHQIDDGTQKIRKKSSAAKVAANRQNSLKSTGPRTEQGKRNSKFNAVKHGLLAKDAVLAGPEAIDQRREFNKLLIDLCNELKPVGVVEMHVVEEYAICMLRSKRVVRFENAWIRCNYWKVGEKEEPEPIVHPKRTDELYKTRKGLSILIGFLRPGLNELRKDGLLRPETRARIKEYFPVMVLWEKFDDDGGDGKSKTAQNSGERLANHIEREIELLEHICEEKALRQFDIEIGMGLIPPEEELQRLQRYETANDRKKDRLLERLYRLQEHRRKGCQGGTSSKKPKGSTTPTLIPEGYRRSEDR